MNTYEASYVTNPKNDLNSTIFSSSGWSSKRYYTPFTPGATTTFAAGWIVESDKKSTMGTADHCGFSSWHKDFTFFWVWHMSYDEPNKKLHSSAPAPLLPSGTFYNLLRPHQPNSWYSLDSWVHLVSTLGLTHWNLLLGLLDPTS